MKVIFSLILCFVLILPVFSFELQDLGNISEDSNNTVLKGEAECEMLPPIEEEIKPVKHTLTNIEYDAKYLKDGKAKNFERSNIEYSGVTDFFKY